MSIPPLPEPGPGQAFCNVSALEAGVLRLPCDYFVTSAKKGEFLIAPSLSFLITHAHTGDRLLFDLGIRKDIENSIKPLIQRIDGMFKPSIPQDVSEALARGGLTPTDITHICLSHCHWDHVGNPALFTNATFIVGGEARSLFQPGYPEDPKSIFASDLLPDGRTEFLDTKSWGPIGPFSKALDYYGDGSLYIVDAPGHLPGHVNILVRTSSDGSWLYLAGDSAHDWRLVRGQGDITISHNAHGETICAHRDKEQAEITIKKIAGLMTLPRVRILLAHDYEWYAENKGGEAFWPGKISAEN